MSDRPTQVDTLRRLAVFWMVVMLTALGLYLVSPVHDRLTFIALFAASLPIALVRPVWTFYVLIATFPFGELRHEAHWAIGAALILSLAARYTLGTRSPAELRASLWPWVLAFVAANILSNLLSPHPDEAWLGFSRLIAGCVFLLLPIALIPRQALMHTVPVVIVGAITTAAALAIAGYLFNLDPFLEQVEVFKRATGGSVSPNTLAMLIILGMPLLVHYALHADRGRWRIAAQAGLVINLGAMVTTYSRGGLLLLLLEALVLAALHLRERPLVRAAQFAAWGLAFLLSTMILTPALTSVRTKAAANAGSEVTKAEKEELDYYWDRQQTVVDTRDFSVSRRLAYISVARDAFLDRPLLGHGTMTFDEIYSQSEQAREYSRRGNGDEHRRSHNTYLEILTGSGVVGLILFGGILLCAGHNGWDAWRASRREGRLKECRLLESFGLSYLFLMLYFGLQSALFFPFFWLYLGLSESARRAAGSPSSRSTRP